MMQHNNDYRKFRWSVGEAEYASFMLHLDLRALIGGALSLVREIAPEKAKDEIPSVPAGGPVPITVAATAEGRTYVGRLSVDVKAIADMIKPWFEAR